MKDIEMTSRIINSVFVGLWGFVSINEATKDLLKTKNLDFPNFLHYTFNAGYVVIGIAMIGLSCYNLYETYKKFASSA